MTIKILGVDFRKDSVSAVLIRGSYKGVWMDAHAHVFLERPEDLEKGLASCLETISGQADLSMRSVLRRCRPTSSFTAISHRRLRIRGKSIKCCPMNLSRVCRFPPMI